ncbi:MAG: hypothetical protein FWD47_03980 [Treponema sp.]|nr:hypothetical protein [Treponema sp.]
MKKAIMILLGVCLLAGFAVAQTPGGSLGPVSFTLPWNPPGNNFQAEIRDTILHGYRLQRGDVFTLKVTYTVSRDVDGIGVGFADMTPWQTLSWRQPRGGEIPMANNGGAVLPAARAGQPVSAEVTITLINRASSAGSRQNTFILANVSPQSQGPITINFSEFILTKTN